MGQRPWFVAEADESDRSLLNLAPEAAILLNVDHDHHATFASLEDVREVFRAFVARLPARGLLVVGPDDEARACARGARCPVRVVGDVPGAWGRVEREPGRRGFALALAGSGRVEVALALAGRTTPTAPRLALADWCGVPLEEGARRLAGARRGGPADGAARPRGRRGGGRRLRPPPGRDPGHLAAARERGAGPDRRRLPAPPALAHARARGRDRGGARGGRRGRGDRRLPRPRARRPGGHRRPGRRAGAAARARPPRAEPRRGRRRPRRGPARRPPHHHGGGRRHPFGAGSWWPAWKNSPSMGIPTTAPPPPELERDAPLTR